MNLSEFVMNVFMIVGMLVCIIVTAIALFYGTCYFVRILIKTFNTKVKSTTELMLEDIKEKNIAKKERNKEKREALKKQKEEKLQLKLESKEEIHKMKLQRYQNKLYAKENKSWEKMFGDGVPRKEFRDHKIDVFEMGKEKSTEEEPLIDGEEKKVDFEPQIITGEDNDVVKTSGELDEDVTTDLSGGVSSNEETNLSEDINELDTKTDENSKNTEAQEDMGDGLNLSEITDTASEQESSNDNADQIQTESEIAQEQIDEKQESTDENEPRNENEIDLKPQGNFDEIENKESSVQENSKEKHKKWRWGKKK